MASQTRRIIAEDNFGNPVVLVVFGDVDAAGHPRITTQVGNLPVTYVRKGEYLTYMGKRLTCDDPDAP
jgi:hypothetical protein